ncbi:hypothetical protein ASPCAL09066 [Aspergillus calidoustus]|uniref:Uncharacterized protein n=1 Tax=Aspergillus calidoustus TaxID=454130 RepID=A0A0U5CRF0_ASPCI|nr:hypothetical protein ASPCAL09066 [Aspergillus calidoustus]
MALPSLTQTPTLYPNCCLSLSTPFLTHLASLLPTHPHFTLSIGSGSGQLEALITTNHRDVRIEGVEVNSSVNLYIEEQDMNFVTGTWELCSRAAQAKAWMFVYPREPKLLMKYIETYGGGEVAEILWLGPKVDWSDYEGCFEQSGFKDVGIYEGGNIGGAEFEVLAVVRKTMS